MNFDNVTREKKLLFVLKVSQNTKCWQVCVRRLFFVLQILILDKICTSYTCPVFDGRCSCELAMTNIITTTTRMWANAQRDGRPAEYRWLPLFNAAKFGWRPLLECRAVTLPRRKTRWNLQGCPKVANRSQPLVGRSSPYYQGMWRRYCCLKCFFFDCRYIS